MKRMRVVWVAILGLCFGVSGETLGGAPFPFVVCVPKTDLPATVQIPLVVGLCSLVRGGITLAQHGGVMLSMVREHGFAKVVGAIRMTFQQQKEQLQYALTYVQLLQHELDERKCPLVLAEDLERLPCRVRAWPNEFFYIGPQNFTTPELYRAIDEFNADARLLVLVSTRLNPVGVGALQVALGSALVLLGYYLSPE